MGSSEMTGAGVDSDGSVSWEDFFGTSTDLVPQLLGMFDELARKDEVNNHMNDQIPQSIQKRLSLVAVHSQRNTIFGQISAGKTEQQQQSATSAMQHHQQFDKEKNRVSIEPSLEYRAAPPPPPPLPPPPPPRLSFPSSSSFPSAKVEITVSSEKEISPKKISHHINDNNDDENDDDDDDDDDKKNTLTPKYGRRRKNIDRPLSGSSIGSSTSSSGCSNQGNNGTANPYLTSVESLADTCASSQGSGDSGVVTTSEVNCRLIHNVPIDKSHKVTIDPPFLFHRARYCDPQRNPVEKVLLEIVDTEAIYVEHLRQVIQGYLIYWRNDPTSLLQESELNNLFSNIEDIYKFNHEFLNEIENCSMDPIKISNTFTKRNSGFKIYTEYCTNYPRTVETLTNLMSNDDTAKEFRERQAALCHALPLGSFLLKPVQRILKYHLLLDSLSREYDTINLQYYDDKIEGKKSINDALNGMMDIAKHINAMKRKHEHAVRVQVIQSLLYGWPGPDLTTSGELVAEGKFRMRGAKAPRHAFLFERMLLLTKQKEDGLLVYKAHIMCSNLMLVESIPGEPCSFHVIPFDNPRLQYTLQAHNSEQKREWTLQIKRVMLENYNAVIPMNSRQLLLQIGQTEQVDDNTNCDKISMKKQNSSPPEYLERRKLDKERRRSEAGLRQKGKKILKSETTDNSPLPSRKIDLNNETRDCSLNRSFDGRASKVKDRFTSWRRKSEPGFQSYVSLNQSDEEQIDNTDVQTEVEVAIDALDYEIIGDDNLKPEENEKSNNINTKDVNEQQSPSPPPPPPPRTMEEIVGHILMQNQEFQKLLEKQRNNSMTNVRQQQRFNKHQNSVDTSDDSDNGETNYPTDNSSSNNSNNINNNNSNNSSLSINSSNNNAKGNRMTRLSRRESRLIRSNNNWNSLSSSQSRDNVTNLRLKYNNLKIDSEKSQTIDNISSKIKTNRVSGKEGIFENFKRQSIVTQSKIIKTALRIRENSPLNEEIKKSDEPKIDDNKNMTNSDLSLANSSSSCGNYDNLQNLWNGLENNSNNNNNNNQQDSDSPTRPVIWLSKLCEGLPTSPQKCGSLPRSFQINPSQQTTITKSRFLQRDGKPMTERPFTIASDKPAEINLEDMERYASNYQPEGRIAKFPISSVSGTTTSSSSSSYSCSIDDNLTDANHMTVTETDIHPDHKIYRLNSGNKIFKNVLSKAGSRLQGLKSTVSSETLESVDDYDARGSKRHISKVNKKKNKSRLSRESSTDIDEPTTSTNCPSLSYKQGSSGLGARIAQADYADPSVLFFDTIKRPEPIITNDDNKKNVETIVNSFEINLNDDNRECGKKKERNVSETDSFYEKCFETIENYIDTETDDAFRDSAIFSDGDEGTLSSSLAGIKSKTVKLINESTSVSKIVRGKVAPPVPMKNRKLKPSIARKPDNLKMKVKIVKKFELEPQCVKVTLSSTKQSETLCNNADVSAGQSQAGWVKKIVGQLQGQIET